MTAGKKITVAVTAVFIVCIIGFLTFTFPWWFIAAGSWLAPNPPQPEITYAEFPFRLTYEINGEAKVIEDVIICEFNGFEMSNGGSKYRKWTSRLKSGNEEIILLDLTANNEINEFGYTMLNLFFYWGTPAYYMGDLEHYNCRPVQGFEWVEYKYQTTDGTVGKSAYKADVAYEKYKIKLIEWEIAEPIKNRFGYGIN